MSIAVELQNPLATAKVLLVDDSLDALIVFSALLGQEGALVDVASDGATALELVRTDSYDILISDLGMPVMTGLELIRLVRELDLKKRPMALALSGFGIQREMQDALLAGFDGLLVKPTSMADVKALLLRLRVAAAANGLMAPPVG